MTEIEFLFEGFEKFEPKKTHNGTVIKKGTCSVWVTKMDAGSKSNQGGMTFGQAQTLTGFKTADVFFPSENDKRIFIKFFTDTAGSLRMSRTGAQNSTIYISSHTLGLKVLERFGLLTAECKIRTIVKLEKFTDNIYVITT